MTTVSKNLKKDTKYELWRYKIFGITWLAYAGFYLTRASFAVAKIGISEDPAIPMTSEQMGMIDGIYLIGYAVGQFVWGILGDKLGTRKIVLGGLFTSIIAGFAMGVSSILLAFGVFALVQGLSQSTGWAPLAKNITNWHTEPWMGMVRVSFGIYNTPLDVDHFIHALKDIISKQDEYASHYTINEHGDYEHQTFQFSL